MKSALLPFDGETFTSWIYRLSVYNKLPRLSVDTVKDLFLDALSKGSFDPDFDSSCQFSITCRDICTLPRHLYEGFYLHTSQWIFPRYYRRSYCYRCFCEQIPIVGHPAVLKEWAIVYCTICSKHEVLLQDGAYGACKFLAVGSELFSFHNDVLHGRNLGRLSPEQYRVTSAVQLMISSSELHAAESNEPLMDSFFSFVKLFIEIMLYPDFGPCSQLFARNKSLPSDVVVWKKLLLGPFLASTPQRNAAILLLGWAIGVDGSNCEILNSDYIHTLFQLGRVSNVIGSTELERILRLLSADLQYAGIHEFVEGYCSKSN